ncbi:hypothetical protein [Nitrosomonas ureae]|uniref:Uncharacterized protein n=1 Tax=Nitrosomonas ureae TaxID=44577 RepID=A0A286A1Y7_9PROT|nr:hypothetical protein [Nitrosomonas ureae]SOD15919.1 hypothetical protein SAMN06297164_0143 [Nitrosomonas ureae]
MLLPSAVRAIVFAMIFDTEKFLPYMKDIDLPLSQKRDIIQTVWIFVEAQVDQAWDMHPMQCCPKREKNFACVDSDRIDSRDSSKSEQFNALA